MKILHLCLGCFYIDNYSYQENMLPKYHKALGNEVSIIASLLTFDSNGKSALLKEARSYENEYGITVHRLYYKKFFRPIQKILRRYQDTYKYLELEKPNVIFIHGPQFLDMNIVIKYIKNNPGIKVYVDNHADFSNSARNAFSKYILHKVIWRYCVRLIEPYTEKFYGVLPARVEFLHNVYNVPKEKIELLVMGADDELVETARRQEMRQAIRDKYNISDDDFLIITGGKIDFAKKQTLYLMQAIRGLENKNLKLLVFGSVINELKESVNNLCDNSTVKYIGWVPANDSYNIFGAADLVVFPGRHSVFWEQVTGLGIPTVVKYWEGTTHIDLGGNCEFLFNDSVDEIRAKILSIYNSEKHRSMKRIAEEKGMDAFSYRKIAERSVEITKIRLK